MAGYETLRWVGDAATGSLRLIDQTLLPEEYRELDCRTVQQVWEAIRVLRVRGLRQLESQRLTAWCCRCRGCVRHRLSSFGQG